MKKELARKNETLTKVAATIMKGVLAPVFRREYENEVMLSQYQDNGFLLLPRHHRNLDICHEGIALHELMGRTTYQVMKPSLPISGLLTRIGGIPIPRGKDIKKLDREARKKAIAEYKEKSNQVWETIADLVGNGEIVTIHPEGTRNPGKPGKINHSVLEKIIEVEQKNNYTIPCIPLDTQYEQGGLRTKVHMRFGEPIVPKYTEELADYLAGDLGLIID